MARSFLYDEPNRIAAFEDNKQSSVRGFRADLALAEKVNE
jgi:hypothetical protein